MKKYRTLADMLGSYAAENTARFHMPGHKGGRGLSKRFLRDMGTWDITEIPGADNLHHPEGVIASAQSEAAKAFGAAHTFFLVNGSTAGVLAMFLSLGMNRRVIVQRDCHHSVVSALALCGGDADYILPEYDEVYDLYGSVSAQAVAGALDACPEACAVLINSPSYYGLCPDIAAIAREVHARGKLLLVDSAHGAHFGFSPKLPPSPAGFADMWVQSAHKTLNALNQAALLHTAKSICAENVQRALELVQTTSPSYPVLASIDWALYSLKAAPDAWTNTVDLCRASAQKLNRLAGIHVLGDEIVGCAAVGARDATRMIIDVSARALTGYQTLDMLRRSGVQAEFADERRIGCIMTPADAPEWHEKLIGAIRAYTRGDHEYQALPTLELPQKVMSVREAAFSPARYAPIEECEGAVAAHQMGIYPPGAALYMPGERITQGGIAFIKRNIALGADVFGLSGGRAAIINF